MPKVKNLFNPKTMSWCPYDRELVPGWQSTFYMVTFSPDCNWKNAMTVVTISSCYCCYEVSPVSFFGAQCAMGKYPSWLIDKNYFAKIMVKSYAPSSGLKKEAKNAWDRTKCNWFASTWRRLIGSREWIWTLGTFRCKNWQLAAIDNRGFKSGQQLFETKFTMTRFFVASATSALPLLKILEINERIALGKRKNRSMS